MTGEVGNLCPTLGLRMIRTPEFEACGSAIGSTHTYSLRLGGRVTATTLAGTPIWTDACTLPSATHIRAPEEEQREPDLPQLSCYTHMQFKKSTKAIGTGQISGWGHFYIRTDAGIRGTNP